MARERNDVHVAFDDHETIDLPQGLARLVQAVEFAALVKQHRFRGVEVLRLAVAHRAAAESDTASADVADGKHDAVAKPVVVPAVVLADHESRGEEAVDGLLRRAELVEHRAPGIGGVAEAEALGGAAVDAALLQVVDRCRVFPEALLPEALDARHQVEEFVIAARRAIRLVARHLHAHRVGEALDRLDETHVVELHEEADRRAVGAATEAVIEALRRAHGERRCFLVMERTAGLELPAGLLQLHAAADHFDDIGPCDQVVDEILGNQSSHSELNVCSAASGLDRACSYYWRPGQRPLALA